MLSDFSRLVRVLRVSLIMLVLCLLWVNLLNLGGRLLLIHGMLVVEMLLDRRVLDGLLLNRWICFVDRFDCLRVRYRSLVVWLGVWLLISRICCWATDLKSIIAREMPLEFVLIAGLDHVSIV